MTASDQTKAAKATADALLTHDTLAEALVAALSELTVVETGRTAEIPMKSGGKFSYKYADIGDVVKLTRPILAAHGVVALTPVHDHGNGLACTVTFLHTSGQQMDLGPFPFPHGHDAQSTGSSVTYHRRYALVAALGMAAGDDDDGAAAKAPRKTAPTPHPLRAEATEALWSVFLSRAGISDGEADALLELDEGWRTWLEQGIAAHAKEQGE